VLNLAQDGDISVIKGMLLEAGLRNGEVSPTESSTRSFEIAGTTGDLNEEDVRDNLLGLIADNTQIVASKPFPKVRFLGPNVVADLKGSAIKALLMSLICILAYIWFRFKELKYGVAATVALVHDVSIAAGVTVFCYITGLVQVPITLNVIAGFLTIVGYSLNDTIVVFDRIRENHGNMKGSFQEVVNRSINQTLTRTVLTSLTTLFVVAVIFFMNLGFESPLEGLAFVLMIGIIVGTYSSIFIASPILVWVHNRELAKSAGREGKKALAASN
ncbi:MAG: protein translocase subunit SecF, partial [Planctomycetes bacterium]|nr:protein translocase subunit SecF [Planctomycetota bacterium]